MQVLRNLHPNKFTVRFQSRQTAREVHPQLSDSGQKIMAAEARRARRNAKRAREAKAGG